MAERSRPGSNPERSLAIREGPEQTRQVRISQVYVRALRLDNSLDLTVEPAVRGFLRPAGLIPRQTFTESLILAQDERWRRA